MTLPPTPSGISVCDDPDRWAVEPITPIPTRPSARVLLNGDY